MGGKFGLGWGARFLSLGIAAGVCLISVSGLTASPKVVEQPTPEQARFFEERIRPVLATKCGGCHGKDQPAGGLRVDSREALLKGGSLGASIVPGEPDKSLLMLAIRQTGNLKMPLGGKLASEDVANFDAWIKSGALWPSSQAKTTENLWSLQPVKRPVMPITKASSWVRNPIDAFVLTNLRKHGLTPAPEADRRTLIRRVTYDLTGLPPTPEQVIQFQADRSPKAYEQLVDRLLASPQYGERWARHWMDVARYADTKGYVFEEDRNYYNAYTYRDWLINALNRDLPYDQFIVQQLAADRLPSVRNGDDQTPLAALGFLTLGRRFLNQQPDIIDDRIDVTMRGLQGFTMGCARCHDHKFDPIPTQDYYSLYGVFASSEEASLPISERKIREPWNQYQVSLAAAQSSVQDLLKTEVLHLRQSLLVPEKAKTVSNTAKDVLQSLREDQIPDDEKTKKLAGDFSAEAQTKLARLQKILADLRANAPATPELAMAMRDSANPSDSYVFKRGKPENRGIDAPRRFLLALSKPNGERPHWTQGSGRWDLAQSIASKDNPLTARVFVNRVWQHHFGAAIVRTPSDFGHQGERPTDPALLDYLAWSFMDHGWSIKSLHKLIVMSSTYRQSSAVTPAKYEADPENRLWGRMNRQRLDLEETRDSMMAASGKLDLTKIGGKSVDLWKAPFVGQRAVYGFVDRQNLPGVFRTFDFASPDSTNARRFQTTVPQQALFFMNSPISIEQSTTLVSRKELATTTDEGKLVRRLYLMLFQRLPDAQETTMGISFLHQGPDLVPMPVPLWSYGYGEIDPGTRKTRTFQKLEEFRNSSYQAGQQFPDPTLGYLLLSPQGGHPGRDKTHAVIRRWTAPSSMAISISGTVSHGNAQGDGILAEIVSSRRGILGSWKVHNGTAAAEIASYDVEKGETLDFVVDPMTSDAFDGFGWRPVIKCAARGQVWDAGKDFGPPPPPPMTRLALYAQALMMSNEFMFLD